MELLVIAALFALPVVIVICFIVSLVKLVKARRTGHPKLGLYKNETIILGVLTAIFGTAFVGIMAVFVAAGRIFANGINNM